MKEQPTKYRMACDAVLILFMMALFVAIVFAAGWLLPAGFWIALRELGIFIIGIIAVVIFLFVLAVAGA